MTLHQPLNQVTGDDLNQRFREMTLAYGVMMTGANPEVIGQMQAERLTLAESQFEKDIPAYVSKLVEKNADAMLEPPDCCGDVSNLVCTIFLGEKASRQLAAQPYVTCAQSDEFVAKFKSEMLSLRQQSPDLLGRFEIVRVKTDLGFKVFKDVSTEDELQRFIEGPQDKSNAAQKCALVLLRGEICFCDHKKIKLLSTTPSEKQLLVSLFDKFNQGFERDKDHMEFIFYSELRDKYYGIAAVLNADTADCESEIKFIERSFNCLLHDPEFDYLWIGTHSYTLLLPDNDKPYHYQAYVTKHSLQQWFSGDDAKFDELARLSLDDYLALCGLLLSNEGADKMKGYGALFRRNGTEFKAFSRSYLVAELIQASEYHVRFKMTTVDVNAADQRLDAIQKLFNQYGQTPAEQLANFKQRVVTSFEKQVMARLQTDSALVTSPRPGII